MKPAKLYNTSWYHRRVSNMHEEMVSDIRAAGSISEEDAKMIAIAIIRKQIRHVKRDLSALEDGS